MKTPEEWLRTICGNWPGAHPDDYDPTDEQLLALITLVQADAIRSAGAVPAEPMIGPDTGPSWIGHD